ncbi:MAG TPA: hypothetical protein VKC62_00505, partial [Gaiellaceae bacterium]|nr:hypothetical protein [Gaiellaceae bacterium]
MKKTGFKPWNPHRSGVPYRMLLDVEDILATTIDDLIRSLTTRSILYRLLDRGWEKSNGDRL